MIVVWLLLRHYSFACLPMMGPTAVPKGISLRISRMYVCQTSVKSKLRRVNGMLMFIQYKTATDTSSRTSRIQRNGLRRFEYEYSSYRTVDGTIVS